MNLNKKNFEYTVGTLQIYPAYDFMSTDMSQEDYKTVNRLQTLYGMVSMILIVLCGLLAVIIDNEIIIAPIAVLAVSILLFPSYYIIYNRFKNNKKNK